LKLLQACRLLQQHLQRHGRLPLFDLNFGWADINIFIGHFWRSNFISPTALAYLWPKRADVADAKSNPQWQKEWVLQLSWVACNMVDTCCHTPQQHGFTKHNENIFLYIT
jgi:hypothetical protein